MGCPPAAKRDESTAVVAESSHSPVSPTAPGGGGTIAPVGIEGATSAGAPTLHEPSGRAALGLTRSESYTWDARAARLVDFLAARTATP